MKSNRMLCALFSVSGIILLAKLLGFFKQAAAAAAFGATIETDLINLAEGLIGNIQYVLAQVVLTSFTAVYIHSREEGEEQAGRFAVDVVRALSLIALGLSAAVMLAAPLAARIIAPGYSRTLSARLAGYLRLFAPMLVLFAWNAVFRSLLNAHRRFVSGELTGLYQSVIVLVLVFTLGEKLGADTLALAFFACHIWNTLYLGVLSRKYRTRSRGNPFRNKSVRKLLRMAGPLLLSYSMVFINQQVDKALASGLAGGTVTAMGCAAVLSNLAGTFIGSFCAVLYTEVTVCISKGEHRRAAELTSRAAALLVLAFWPVSLLTVLCAEDIVSIVYGRGAFDAAAVRAAAQSLRGYGFSFVPLVLRELFSRFQYGYQDTRRPMRNSTAGILTNVALSIALCPRLGVFGIALASSVSVLVCGTLNMAAARRHSEMLSFRLLLELVPWMAIGGALCWFAARWGMTGPLANQTPPIRFMLTALLGFGACAAAALPPLWRLVRKKSAAH